ncbi:hypothetical protein J3E74DRAFT_419081 [Bipolaris maydis]|nr:hypothetical protein J3E74DRAFT_419081 [Bipolaris maydis]
MLVAAAADEEEEDDDDDDDDDEVVAAGVAAELELAASAAEVEVAAEEEVVDIGDEDAEEEAELELEPEPELAPALLLPASTVMGLATIVCIVLEEPSWNAGAGGGAMEKEPAGHRQEQLQPPFSAARVAAAAAASPPPAITVTAGPTDVPFEEPPLEPIPEAMEVDPLTASAAAVGDVPLPAITVTGPAAPPEAASAVAEAPLLEGMDDPAPPPLIMPAGSDEFPDPATTVTAAAGGAALLPDALLITALLSPEPPSDAMVIEAPLELAVTLPWAMTAIGLPTAVVVVAAARPPGVRVAVLIDAMLVDMELETASAAAGEPPSAINVTAAAVPLLAIEPGEAISAPAIYRYSDNAAGVTGPSALALLFIPPIFDGELVQGIGVTAGRDDFPGGVTVMTGFEEGDPPDDIAEDMAGDASEAAFAGASGDVIRDISDDDGDAAGDATEDAFRAAAGDASRAAAGDAAGDISGAAAGDASIAAAGAIA